MSYREILRILSSFFYLYSIILCVPLLIAAFYQFRIEHYQNHPQTHTTIHFLITLCICLALAWLSNKGVGKVSSVMYRQREAIVSVVIIWFLIPAIGALPFIFSGTLERFDQAYFEAVSAFTTTGATVLEAKIYDPTTGQEIPHQLIENGMHEVIYRFYGNVKPIIDPQTGKQLLGLEAVSRALLFWRSLMQWIGGMGIIVLFVAFLPELGVKGKFLFQTETPGPLKEGFKPRIKETALQLWEIYLGLTVLEICLLLIVNSKISLFDAITISFSTLSTGGFSVHNENIGYYQQAATEWVVLIFMIFGSINFSLYYSLFKGKFYRLFDVQLLCFISIILILGSFVAWQLNGIPLISLSNHLEGTYSPFEALRIGFFQLVSALTSTGFFVAKYDVWPYVIQVLLLIAMFMGGMSGSTAGGIKTIRLQILFQVLKNKIESIFWPKTIKITHIGDKEIENTTAVSVLCFFLIVIVTSVLSTFIYVWDHIDPETALSLTACMINNTGLGFRAAGTSDSMAFLSPFSNYLSSFLMILGRLEYYAVLALLFPAFWENR